MTDQPTTDQPTTDQPTTDQPTTKAPRQSHTPAERATEAVSVLQRRLDKLTKSKAAFELQALELEPQIEAMQKRLDYALASPDLPPKAPGAGVSAWAQEPVSNPVSAPTT